MSIMKTVSAREAKNEFGAFLEAARKEPVIVTRHDRPVAALVPIELLAQIPKYRAAGGGKRGVDIASYVGRARGLFASPKEVDAFIAAERKSWP
jgi:prevent-host-death family protein